MFCAPLLSFLFFICPTKTALTQNSNSYRKRKNALKFQQQRHNRENPSSLVSTLWDMSRSTLIPSGACQLVAVLCQVSVPLLVQQLLYVIEDHPKQNLLVDHPVKSIVLAIAILFVLLLNALMTHRYRHLALQSGITLRSSLLAVVYHHILHLAPASSSSSPSASSGEITNLIAIDTQKVGTVRLFTVGIYSNLASMTRLRVPSFACLVSTKVV